MPEKKDTRIEADKTIFIPPEGVARITGSITYDGRWYEDLGQEEHGAYDDPVTGEHIPGKMIQKYGRLLQAVDDGNPNTPVWYEPYEGDDADYKPTKRTDAYESNVSAYVAERKFEGHPTDPEDLGQDRDGITTVNDLSDEERKVREKVIGNG